MNIQTKGKEFDVESKSVGKWLTSAEAYVLKIKGLFYFESSKNKTPGFTLVLESAPVEGLDPHTRVLNKGSEYEQVLEMEGQYCETTFWMTEKTMNIEETWSTLNRFTHMADVLGLREKFDELNEGELTPEQIAENWNGLFQGVKAAFIIRGEEQEMSDGNTIVKPEMSTMGADFVAPVDQIQKLRDIVAEAKKKNSGAFIKKLEKVETPVVQQEEDW